MAEGAAADLLGLVGVPRRAARGRWAGRGERSDFVAVWSWHWQGWVLPAGGLSPRHQTSAVRVLQTGGTGSWGVSGGLGGQGRFPRWESSGMTFPGQLCSPARCPGPTLALSQLAVTFCLGSARPQPPLLWNLLVGALGPLLGFFSSSPFFGITSRCCTSGVAAVGHFGLCWECCRSLSNWFVLGSVEEIRVQCQVTLLLRNLTVQRDVTCPFFG